MTEVRARRRVCLRGALILLLAVLACAPPDPRPNVLLILLDTVRADKLGRYGSELGLTPHLDRLADQGVLFENASSHAPWTLPAAASILTSLHPGEHAAGGAAPRFTSLDPSVATLPGLYGRAGYATAAVINVAFLGADFGMTRGFEHVDAARASNQQARPAAQTTDAALSWLGRSGARPFFLLVHYFDPHLIYDPPEDFRRRFAAPEDRESASFVFGSRRDIVRMRRTGSLPDLETLERLERLYDGEIAYTDSEVGRLLAGLRDLELEQETVVVLTSDHGEEFLDHGGFEHGHTLYSELTHVPLLLRWPAGPAGRRVKAGVRHLDVAPTLCELTGVEADAGFAGRSLLGLLGDERAHRPVWAHGNFWGSPLRSFRVGEYKLILPARGGNGAPELYHWTQDPGEREDLARAHPERVERLSASLARFEAAKARSRARPGAEVELPEASRRQLESLGYLTGGEAR